jgi:tetratricopeptide (TPR) repeat protein
MRAATMPTILLLLFCATALPAQETEPAWLVVERAELLLVEREFGLAIQSFRRALDLAPDDPEALFGLGRAYKAVGDLSVAEDYFARALEHRADFTVGATALLVRYERADIYRTRRDFARYEAELFSIVAEDTAAEDTAAEDTAAEDTAGDADGLVPGNLHAVLNSRGLDRLLVLYRLDETGATRARGMLAELLVGLGRYEAAAEHAAFAVVQSLSTLIGVALERDPTYEFSTVTDMWERVARYAHVREYLASATLLHDLYYLGAAYWGERNDTAFAIWRTLASLDPDGRWGDLARRRIADPRPEPLLVPSREE